jgi:hypothetical protein
MFRISGTPTGFFGTIYCPRTFWNLKKPPGWESFSFWGKNQLIDEERGLWIPKRECRSRGAGHHRFGSDPAPVPATHARGAPEKLHP